MTPRVLALFPGKERPLGGCEIYRVTVPLMWLEKKYGWSVEWAFFDALMQESVKRGQGIWRWMLDEHDLLIFPRFFMREDVPEEMQEILLGVFDMFRKVGKAVVYEVDDDYSNDHRKVIQGDAMVVASKMNAVTVTTPFLGEMMTEKTGLRHYVLPNMFTPDLFFAKPPKKITDKLIIGLTGSESHVRDWEVLKDVIPVLAERKDIHLIVGGFHPEYIEEHENISFVPGLPYEQYVQLIQALDIVLAPVNGEQFNLYKSPIKAVEGMAARRPVGAYQGGAAVIASDNEVYRLAVEHDKTGLLVAYEPQAWLNAIEELIANERKRQSLQVAGHEFVRRKYDISKRVGLWADAYQSVLRKGKEQPS